MPGKKSVPKKTSTSLLHKIGEQVAHGKDKLIEEKNHLTQMASETFETIKEKVHDLRAAKPAAKKKAAVKKSVRKSPKKPVKKAPVKKAPVKKAKKVVKKKVAKKR